MQQCRSVATARCSSKMDRKRLETKSQRSVSTNRTTTLEKLAETLDQFPAERREIQDKDQRQMLRFERPRSTIEINYTRHEEEPLRNEHMI